MIAGIFFTVIAVSVVISILSRTGLKDTSMGEHLVGGRSFPAWLLYFLAVGEIYSIGTMIGLPSGIYAGGASYGIWFIGYILLAYPIGYFLAPLVWRAGVRYDAMTIPDVISAAAPSRSSRPWPWWWPSCRGASTSSSGCRSSSAPWGSASPPPSP